MLALTLGLFGAAAIAYAQARPPAQLVDFRGSIAVYLYTHDEFDRDRLGA
ncbi:hypothetical protein AB0M54_46690 [Actinoplanes sp. NPDC051470]